MIGQDRCAHSDGAVAAGGGKAAVNGCVREERPLSYHCQVVHTFSQEPELRFIAGGGVKSSFRGDVIGCGSSLRCVCDEQRTGLEKEVDTATSEWPLKVKVV